MKNPSIFLVFGTKLNNDLDNVQVLNSIIIPNTDDTISFDSKRWKVIGKHISYSNVQEYEYFDDPDRGAELIYIFVVPN